MYCTNPKLALAELMEKTYAEKELLVLRKIYEMGKDSFMGFLTPELEATLDLRWSSKSGHKTLSVPFIFDFQLFFKLHRAFVA